MIPLARPTFPTGSDHYFQLRRLFCDILKSGDGRTDRNMCENNDHYRPAGTSGSKCNTGHAVSTIYTDSVNE